MAGIRAISSFLIAWPLRARIQPGDLSGIAFAETMGSASRVSMWILIL